MTVDDENASQVMSKLHPTKALHSASTAWVAPHNRPPRAATISAAASAERTKTGAAI